MNHLDSFLNMIKEQDPDSFFDLKGKIAVKKVKPNTSFENQNCVVVHIPAFKVEFVFWEGKFKGIVRMK